MKENDLFCEYDASDNLIYYLDEEHTKPYTGHTEDFFKGILSRECDIVDGYMNGVCKEYYDLTGELEMASQMDHGLMRGLSIEFYKNGRVRAVSIVFNNWYVDSIGYDENGKVTNEDFCSEGTRIPHFSDTQKIEIQRLKEKYDLGKIHEEIMREGKNFKYEKYFEQKT